jgi:hypothetical protein
LPDNLAADSRVGAALHLDDGRNAVLVEEEMIDAPGTRSGLVGPKRDLPRNWQPAPRRIGVDLVARKEIRMASQKLLQAILKLVRPFRHLNELITPCLKKIPLIRSVYEATTSPMMVAARS